MVKTKTAFLLTALLIFSMFAAASMIIPANENAKENAKAPEKSPVIGENWALERVEFIHYAKPTNPGKPTKTDTCYKLMGVKWTTTPVTYKINPSNPQGLDTDIIVNKISASAETWDDATSLELLNDNFEVDYSAEYDVQDYQNAIAFGDYGDDRVIAVTTIWYTRLGKRIVEFDMLFNTRYNWGEVVEGDNTTMDLQNIATHEFGHGVGLSDIYTTSCSYVTMYGYSYYGDTEKRTLAQPDITGLQKIYGT